MPFHLSYKLLLSCSFFVWILNIISNLFIAIVNGIFPLKFLTVC